jgi:hypothetical protein
MEQENDSSPQSVSILRPANNAYIRNSQIDVVGTTPIKLPIVLRMFKGSVRVAEETAHLNSGNWSATIKGTFEPGQYRIEVTQSGSVNVTVNLHVPIPTIQSPQNGQGVDSPFPVSGIGGESGFGTIELYSLSAAFLGHATPGTNGNWNTEISLPTGVSTFHARQKIGAYSSAPSVAITVKPPAPHIEKPGQNETGVTQRPVISGTGTPRATVNVWQTNPRKNLVTGAVVDANRNWSKVSEVDLDLGQRTIRAQATLDGVPSSETVDRTFNVTPAIPQITGPDADVLQSPTFDVIGTDGVRGCEIQILKDLGDNTPLGKGVLQAGGNWTVSVTVPVGQISLVAEQVSGVVRSGRGLPRSFRIRPPAFTAVNVEHPTETSVKFSGTGHTGATVELTVVSGPGETAPPPVTVKDGKWETTATNWKFGTYTLEAIQKVPDNASGWIKSQPYTFSVTLQFPDVSDVTYTKDYQPTFSGKGLNGATVKLFNSIDGPKIAPDVLVSNGQWSSKASAVWGPTLNREIFIKQYLNAQESPNWVKPKVTIPPLAPMMNDPVENGLSPNLSGTCWPGAVLSLEYSDSTTVHPVPNNNGTWSFRRDLPFEPEKIHTVTITQTVGGEPSPPASKTFMVYAPIPQPVITSPAPNSEVGRDMTVKGTSGMKGATMQLRDAQYGRKLGAPTLLTSNGAWLIRLTGLEFRRYTIDAQQTRDQRPSVPSEPRTFDVVLLPPVITVPMENGNLPRTAILEGGGMPGGQVTVWLRGIAEPICKDIAVDFNGRWKAEVTLPVGAKVIWARQTFANQTSEDSQRLSYNVVPAAPFIETPVTGECIGRRVVVSGFGVPGDTVAVKLGNAALMVLGLSPVLEDRTWSVEVECDQPDGLYDVVAVASCDGFDSADSATRPVVLGTYRPSVDVPAQGQWVSHPVRFKGQGQPGSGQVVSWFNPNLVWAPNVPVTDGWQGEAKRPLPSGGNWCWFRQTLTEGAAVSDRVEIKRFEVLPPSSTQT